VDLDTRQNDHQQLTDLGAMAFAVLRAVVSRLEMDGRVDEVGPATFLAANGTGFAPVELGHIERPPFAGVAANQADSGDSAGGHSA
jgi:hypothetical protein